MSNIMSALREIELEQPDAAGQAGAHPAASVAPSEFSVLKEFTARSVPEPETCAQQDAVHPEPGHEAVILFADDYLALEDRIVRVVETIRRERQARVAAEERATNAEEQLSRQTLLIEDLEQQIGNRDSISDERSQSIARMVNLLDSLENFPGE
jgi:uncharacterized coiled-coil protein SlyX